MWTLKEKSHLHDVRNITDGLIVGTLIALPFFVTGFSTKNAGRSGGINCIIILSFLLVIPFFPYFWRHIFHPLLFTNRNWLNTPMDFSYYLFPRVFFKYTMLMIIFMSSLINAAAWSAYSFLGKKGHCRSDTGYSEGF
jgi:hypothetical protein